jgi:hypothetical protein
LYLDNNNSEGYYVGNEKLARRFIEDKLNMLFRPLIENERKINFDDFIKIIKERIKHKFEIEVEYIDETERVGYEIKNTIKNEKNDIIKFFEKINKLLIKSINLKEKSHLSPTSLLKIKFSLSKLSTQGKKSLIKIKTSFFPGESDIFKELNETLKKYDYIIVDSTDKEKLEYFLIKKKIMRTSIDDNFLEELKYLGIISEKKFFQDSK